MEAHGGYAFCGVAALTLLGHERLCDVDALLVSSCGHAVSNISLVVITL